MRNGFLAIIIRTCAFAVLLFAASQLVTQEGFTDAKKSRLPKPEFVPGEILVKLRAETASGASAQAQGLVRSLLRKYDVSSKSLQTDKTFVKLTVKNDVPMEQLIAEVQENKAVEYAEPNWIYRAFDTPDLNTNPSSTNEVLPNDPGFPNTWGLKNTGQKDGKGQSGTAGADIGAARAWKTTTGSKDIVVAIIDTGIDYTHEDLKNNIWTNPGEIPGNKIDDDGNGFVDDVRGWDFANKDSDPMDDNAHGTHCAGTIGGDGNNGIGVAGVNWKVSLMPLKFLSQDGSGTLEAAVEAIKYATKMKVNVMSNSWGAPAGAKALDEAIKAASDAGILFVAAAGNDSNDNDNEQYFPASYTHPNMITVAATDNHDRLAKFSNYGKKGVHLAAPGVSIYSTVPKTALETKDKSYEYFSGTSMATPHVAGAAALLWSENKGWTSTQIKERLLATVDPIRLLSRKVDTGGRLNVNNALTNFKPDRLEPNPREWKSMAQQLESAHPYVSRTKQSFEIVHPGAKYIRVHFKKIDVEKSWDFINILDSKGEVMEEVSGTHEDYYSEYIDGDKLTIRFEADYAIEGYGFVVDKYEFID